MSKNAYITVLTNENYINGTVGLSRSLSAVDSTIELYVLIPKGEKNLSKLLRKYNLPFIETDEINLDFDIENSAKYAYWKNTFIKLAATRLVMFDKIVLLDSDLLILQNIDDLFELSHRSAAVAGEGAHSSYKEFNSGVMVIEPDEKLYLSLCESILPAYEMRKRRGLSCGDQDVFHYLWDDWCNHPELKISERYNTFFNDLDVTIKLFENGLADIKVVHFPGAKKPWQFSIIDDMRVWASILVKSRCFDKYRILKRYKKYCEI